MSQFVSQISPPIRILLAGALVFLAAWFTVLRPKADAAPPVPSAPGNVNTSAPAVTGAGKAVEAAKAAAGTEQASGSAPATATAAPAAKPVANTASVPALSAAALKKLPNDVAEALQQRKVLVLGVLSGASATWRPQSDDDRFVKNALRRVNRYHGNVLVKRVPLAELFNYAPIVNDLKVNQTPSIVVVDRDLHATVLAGYVDRITINQAIADARQDSIDRLIKDPYLRKVNAVCGQYRVRATRWSLPTVRGKKPLHAALDRAVAIAREYRHGVQRIPAPARWRGLKSQFVSVMKMREDRLGSAFAALKHDDLAGAYDAIVAFDFAKVRKLDHRFDAVGLTSCSILRRS